MRKSPLLYVNLELCESLGACDIGLYRASKCRTNYLPEMVRSQLAISDVEWYIETILNDVIALSLFHEVFFAIQLHGTRGAFDAAANCLNLLAQFYLPLYED